MFTQPTRRWFSPIVILLAALLAGSTAQAAPPAQGPRPVSVQVTWGSPPDARPRTSSPRGYNDGKIFPEYIFWLRPTVTVQTDLYLPYEPLPFTFDLTYPNPYVAFYASNPIEPGPYITSCNHLADQYKVRCTGNLPALDPPQAVVSYFKAYFIGTTNLLGQSTVTFPAYYEDAQQAVGGNLNIPVATPLNLTETADSPANNATGVLIESSGQGPLLRWHDANPAYVCGDGSDRVTQDIAYGVYLRKQGGSTWQQIGAVPNCSRQIQLSSTALTCKANGDPETYEWNVIAVDIKYIPNNRTQENIFTFTTASCRPVIKEIKPEYNLNPHYFLQNVSVPNKIQVLVDDWNGPAYQTPVSSLPSGSKITFDLNGTVTEKTAQLWGAEHPYDMGTDLIANLTCNNNTFKFKAIYPPYESLETQVQTTVFPYPGWVNWVITHIPGSDASFEATPKAPLVEYAYDFKYPEPPFEANWNVPGWVPYLGGNKLGIKETQAGAGVTGVSDGSGSATVSGQTGFDLAAASINGSVSGTGNTKFECGKSLDLTSAQLNLNVSGTIQKEMGFADLIPGLRAAEGWWLVGRAIRWFNERAKAEASLSPAANIQTNFKSQNDQLVFDNGEGTASVDATVTLAIDLIEDVTAKGYGGGKPYVTVQVPANPGYLKEIGIDLKYGASVEVWGMEASFEKTYNCHYPGGCSAPSQPLVLQPVVPRLIPRKYAGPNYARFVGARNQRDANTIRFRATTAETVLLTNIYPRPQPDLAVRGDGRLLIAYIHDDTSKPQGRGTEVYYLTWNGSDWSAPARLTDDPQPDYAPAVVYDGNGNAVMLWERSTLAEGITPSLNQAFAQSLEIAARTWNSSSGTWSNLTLLTNNSLADIAPRLSVGSDGAVMALWLTNDGTDIMGTADHPLTLTYARWNGTTWSAPTAALTGLRDVLGVAFAARSANQAALAYVVDSDGNLSTTDDGEIYYSTFNGTTWSAPVRMTNDSTADSSPALVYDSVGNLHLVWLRGGNLVWLKNAWNVASAQTIQTGSTAAGFLGLTLARSPNGRVALVWQEMGTRGAELAYSLYNAFTNQWSASQMLTSTTDVESSHSPAFGADGTLYVAYQKIETQFVTGGGFTEVAQPGASALAFLTQTTTGPSQMNIYLPVIMR